MTLTYEQVKDLLPAYAIGALEAEEETAVDEYIRLQQELIQNLKTSENATILLAQGTEHTSLAPDARERMMARIRADAPLSDKPASEPINNKHSTNSQQSNTYQRQNRRSGADNSPSTRIANGAANGLKSRSDAPRPSQGGAGQVIRGRPSSRVSARAPQPRRGAQRPARRPIPEDLFPPKPRRSFMGGLFNARALTNATMAASLVTLLFMTLLNFQGEAQIRQANADLRVNRVKLAQIEGQAENLSQANFALSNSNSELVSQSTRFSEEQATLRAENEQFETTQSQLLTEFSDLKAENETIAIERATLFEENARLQNQLSAISERITLVGAASQATVMFGTEQAPGLQGTFFHKDQEGALVVHGLEPLPSDQAYQFWLVSDEGRQVSAGLFAVSADQEPTWANLELPQDLPSYTLVGVSIEPSGGSASPTGPMLLESSLEEAAPPDTLG